MLESVAEPVSNVERIAMSKKKICLVSEKNSVYYSGEEDLLVKDIPECDCTSCKTQEKVMCLEDI